MDLLTRVSLSCAIAYGLAVSAGVCDDYDTESGFAVDTHVMDESGATVVRTTTLFEGELAYDILDEGATAARFDFILKRVDLLDRDEKLRTELPLSEILKFQAELHRLAGQRRGLGEFLAQPTFIEEYDASRSLLKLSSPWMTYEADVAATDSQQSEQLTRFADWSARLACMLVPTAPPASARVELNQALRKANWRATQVTRRGGPNAPQLGVVTSQHTYRDHLNKSDLALVNAVKKDLSEYRNVSFSEYRRATELPLSVSKK